LNVVHSIESFWLMLVTLPLPGKSAQADPKG